MRLARAAESSGGVLDLTPFVDVMFILIVFFLAAATFQQEERDIEVRLPRGDDRAALSAPPRMLVLNVRQDGGCVLGERAVGFEELERIVREAVESDPQQKVLIRGDRAARHEFVAAAVRACRQAGVAQANIGYDCTPWP